MSQQKCTNLSLLETGSCFVEGKHEKKTYAAQPIRTEKSKKSNSRVKRTVVVGTTKHPPGRAAHSSPIVLRSLDDLKMPCMIMYKSADTDVISIGEALQLGVVDGQDVICAHQYGARKSEYKKLWHNSKKHGAMFRTMAAQRSADKMVEDWVLQEEVICYGFRLTQFRLPHDAKKVMDEHSQPKKDPYQFNNDDDEGTSQSDEDGDEEEESYEKKQEQEEEREEKEEESCGGRKKKVARKTKGVE